MENFIGFSLLFVLSVLISCKKSNPIDLEKKLIGRWRITNSKSSRPNMVVFPINGGGLFIYDSLTERKNGWRSYLARLSSTRDTIIGRQGCTQHYALRISYLPRQDQIVIDDSIVMQHIGLLPK